jgi:ABC-type multidrug transport system permease subunit
MSNDEDLKRRLAQIENELNQPIDNYKKTSIVQAKTKITSRKFPLKYKILIYFLSGLSIAIGISILVGTENMYYFIASITLLLNTLILFVSTLSIIGFLLLISLPSLIFIYIIWRIYRWLNH